MPSPFHPGELAAQERAGMRERIAPFAARALRSFLPQEHRRFFEQLSFVTLAARDSEGRPWLTLLGGAPGVIASPSATQLVIAALPPTDDPLGRALGPGAAVGLLGLDFSTRRRNRLNGTLVEGRAGRLGVQVAQSFGNCKQFITARVLPVDFAQLWAARRAGEVRKRLSAAETELIGSATTFFIGSGAEPYGMDASHRGGPSGFVERLSPTRLRFADYRGNHFYNTVGNLSRDARVALLFLDFDSGRSVQITGVATVDWDSAALRAQDHAARLIEIEIERVVSALSEGAGPLEAGRVGTSHHSF